MEKVIPETDFLNKLHHQIFSPENQAVKASVVILHGMKEHSGRYSEFAEFLSKNGYQVLVYDHVGHGKSASGQELGYIRKENPHDLLIENGKKMSAFLKNKNPDKPHIIIGHSMGSFITRNILMDSSDLYHAAVIIGTGGRRVEIKLMKNVFKGLNSMAHYYKSSWFNQLFDYINSFKFKSETPFDQTNWLSLNKENREKYIADSLNVKEFSVNGFYGLFSLVDEATKKNWASTIPKDFPMFFVSGKEDPIGSFGKGVHETVSDLKENGFVNIDSKIYDGMRHEILNEVIKEKVYQDILEWLNQHVDKTQLKNL